MFCCLNAGSSLVKRPKLPASHAFSSLARSTESERNAYESIAIEGGFSRLILGHEILFWFVRLAIVLIDYYV